MQTYNTFNRGRDSQDPSRNSNINNSLPPIANLSQLNKTIDSGTDESRIEKKINSNRSFSIGR